MRRSFQHHRRPLERGSRTLNDREGRLPLVVDSDAMPDLAKACGNRFVVKVERRLVTCELTSRHSSVKLTVGLVVVEYLPQPVAAILVRRTQPATTDHHDGAKALGPLRVLGQYT